MMNKEFIDALNVLASERNLDKEELLTSIEEALEQDRDHERTECPEGREEQRDADPLTK
jgi:hypothetical protein